MFFSHKVYLIGTTIEHAHFSNNLKSFKFLSKICSLNNHFLDLYITTSSLLTFLSIFAYCQTWIQMLHSIEIVESFQILFEIHLALFDNHAPFNNLSCNHPNVLSDTNKDCNEMSTMVRLITWCEEMLSMLSKICYLVFWF